MALTMTRTRTQTALTKLVERLSNVKGELEYVDQLLGTQPEQATRLLARRKVLLGQKDALLTTLNQFDESLNLEQVSAGLGWRKSNRARTATSFAQKYLSQIGTVEH